MKINKITSARTGDAYYTAKHPSGAAIYVWPRPDYTGAYAIFGAKVGSIDDNFGINGGVIKQVPAGIAHFLEHKMFESEEGDTFARFAKTGAAANAYTAFDRTCYLFSCTDRFDESFEILLDFVQSPYFTEATVQKEQGIIGQEIKMYQDSPEWCVFFNLFKACFHAHPVRTDIAGTVESIAEITAGTLYECYNAFYNPSNMVISVAGNVTPEQVCGIADRMLRDKEPVALCRNVPHEPLPVAQPVIEQKFEVGVPLFFIGFKENPDKNPSADTARDRILTEIMIHAAAGQTTRLYRSLLDDGLINRGFSMEYMTMPGLRLEVFGGESRDPERVRGRLCAEFDRLRAEGISQEVFECARRAVYGGLVAAFGSNEKVGNAMAEAHFYGQNIFDTVEAAATATLGDVQSLLETRMAASRCAMSVVR